MDEMLELFDPNNINKSASAYNEEKLRWLNAQYIKKTSDEKLILLLQELDCDISNHSKKELLLSVCKDRAETLIDLKDAIKTIITPPRDFEPKGVKKFIKRDTVVTLQTYFLILDKENRLDTPEDVEKFTKPFIQKHGLKFPELFQPIRICLTGGTQAPSVYDIIAILGKEETLKRIDFAILMNFDIDEEDEETGY
jgi:glutamyl-tRNA synthetase